MTAPASASAAASRPTYWWIQYLRGLAAAGVVIFHVYQNFPVPLDRTFEIGARGVDVFFVISGFIMYSAARDERFAQFITRRLIRVIPLYWIATISIMALAFVFDGNLETLVEIILSMALIPFYSEAHPAQIWPILVPGWTLSYEMLFYAVFALGIAARRVVAVPALIIATLVSLGAILQPQLAPLVVATKPLLIEFLLGLLIALALHRRPGLLPGIVLATVAVSLGGVALDSSSVAVFAGAAAIVSTALWLERRFPGPPVGGLRLLGDASYSIYLFHIPFLFLFDRVILQLDDLSLLETNALAIAAIVSALSVGVLLHLTIEKPVLRMLNGWNKLLFASPAPAAPLAT